MQQQPVWPPPPPSFFIGFDLGQKHDHTAIAVLERVPVATGEFDYNFYCRVLRLELHLRHAERLPLNTSYPAVAERLSSLCRSSRFQNNKVTLVIDATGVGAPVLDALRRERLPATILPVSITAGGLPTFANGVDRIPKKDLLKRLQLLLQDQRLRVPRGMPGARKLIEEIELYRRAPKRNGGIRFEPGEDSAHDDLLTALMLAAWAGAKTIR